MPNHGLQHAGLLLLHEPEHGESGRHISAQTNNGLSAGGVTSVNYFPLNERYIADALPKDEQFHKGLSQACLKIVDMIKAAV